MKIICDYCGSSVEDDQEKCPNCGGTLNVKPRVNGKPKTLEELKRYCQENGLTAERTRFFIGEDYRGAKAFGIFQNGSGEFVVYKNKADGSRAVRYQGHDEEYAVNEIYTRLQDEIVNQKNAYVNKKAAQVRSGAGGSGGSGGRGGHGGRGGRRGRGPEPTTIIGILIFSIVFIAYIVASLAAGSERGYYRYNGDTYYRLGPSSWYYYDDTCDNWTPTYDLPSELSGNYSDYKESYDDSWGASDFTDTDYYSDWEDSQRSSSYDDDYDDDDDDYDSWDSDWDSSDWDSGSTDWDSDW
ncbi:MAG: zinc ribbon domain-containing protein [Lachnospiraceae bacterium]|nr:zinc ribbon domain-containing protein [Lachnospiraceae bacterium]